ncbi:MAG: hypothetical protein JJT94_13125 [Bernardetiaceae bacterium]|nr:hypothetical protein [Bernardetiaceae bacterium]
MSAFKTREGVTFLVILTVLSLCLLFGAIWAVEAVKSKNEKVLNELYVDFDRLEKAYADEILNLDGKIIPYRNPDSTRLALANIRKDIRLEKDNIFSDKAGTLKRINELYDKKKNYTNQINTVYAVKDEYAVKEIGLLKQEVNKYKQQLDDLIKKNKYLSGQYASVLDKYKGADAELKKLKAEKKKLDELLSEQEFTREQLDSLVTDRDALRELVAKSEELIQKQKEEIERLRGLTRRAYNFTAQYEFRSRRVILDKTGKHKGRIGREVMIAFDVGEGLFDDLEEGQERVVYLTLYRNKQPYKIVKRPIRVLPTGRTEAQIYADRNLEDGDYYFMLTYKEEPIMDKFEFSIR